MSNCSDAAPWPHGLHTTITHKHTHHGLCLWGEEEGGDGPLPDDLNTMSEGELHRRVVGAITRKYQALGRCDAAYVLNATSADAVCVCVRTECIAS